MEVVEMKRRRRRGGGGKRPRRLIHIHTWESRELLSRCCYTYVLRNHPPTACSDATALFGENFFFFFEKSVFKRGEGSDLWCGFFGLLKRANNNNRFVCDHDDLQ